MGLYVLEWPYERSALLAGGAGLAAVLYGATRTLGSAIAARRLDRARRAKELWAEFHRSETYAQVRELMRSGPEGGAHPSLLEVVRLLNLGAAEPLSRERAALAERFAAYVEFFEAAAEACRRDPAFVPFVTGLFGDEMRRLGREPEIRKYVSDAAHGLQALARWLDESKS